MKCLFKKPETKKGLLVEYEHENYDHEFDFLLKFILNEMFVIETVDKAHVLVISEHDVELPNNVIP